MNAIINKSYLSTDIIMIDNYLVRFQFNILFFLIDRGFGIDKYKNKEDDLKTKIDHNTKKHLKSKHRELYENYQRNRHKLDQKRADTQRKKHKTIDRLNGYHFEKLQRNGHLSQEKKFDENAAHKTVGYKNVKRKSITYSSIKQSRLNDEKHDPQNKAHRFNKNTEITKKKGIFVDSSYSDEEKELKFKIHDALRHGDRRFVGRRNQPSEKKKINDTLSYSDEEAVLKSNIYKVFGYEHRMI